MTKNESKTKHNHNKPMKNINNPKINRTRHRLPDRFTTAKIRAEAHRQGLEDERAVIDHLLAIGHIERVRVGHYRKCKRYRGEQ